VLKTGRDGSWCTKPIEGIFMRAISLERVRVGKRINSEAVKRGKIGDIDGDVDGDSERGE
jgi:hypothetical protein